MITREEYENAIKTIIAYKKQLERELHRVKVLEPRILGIDNNIEIIELPKKGDIIEITESFSKSNHLLTGSKYRVTGAWKIKDSAIIQLEGGLILKTQLYKYNIVSTFES